MHTRTKASQHISKLVEVRAAAGVDANDAFLDPINFGDFLVVGATGSTPLVLHFNGPAKVEYEKSWNVPALRVAGRFPIFVGQLNFGIRVIGVDAKTTPDFHGIALYDFVAVFAADTSLRKG